MSQLGIFCTVARTELKEKVPDVSDETLYYLNHAIKQAYLLGLAFGKEEAYQRLKEDVAELIKE